MSNKPDFQDNQSELLYSRLSKALVAIYSLLQGHKRRSVASLAFKLISKLEGNDYRTGTVRKLLKRDYQVEVGVHSYGEAFVPGAFSPSVKIGKYTSIARGVRVFTQNHPIDLLSTHPYFYEKRFGYIENDLLAPSCLEIGHDVWIGQNAIILPGCTSIGDGAIVGAGSIVTKKVPPYAVVAGNPARILRYRFTSEVIENLRGTKWWEMSECEIKAEFSEFRREQEQATSTNSTPT